MSATKPEADIRAIQEAISRLTRDSRKAVIADAGVVAPEITPSAFVIMTRIVDEFPVSPAAIIAVTGFDRSVVSRQLAMLAKEGYLVSEPDPHDGRVALFSPTADAAAKFGEVSKAKYGRVAEVVEDWSQQDVSTFIMLLERFEKSMYPS